MTRVGDDDHIGADGPSRGIPAHRLAPWGSVNVISSYRGMAEAWKSPAAVVQPKGRTPGVLRSKPLTPSRAERRMRPVLSWRLYSCAFTFAHGAADASRVRRSARPLNRRAGRSSHTSGAIAPRDREAVSNRCRCLTFKYERDRNRSLRSLCTPSPHHQRRPCAGRDPYAVSPMLCRARASHSDEAKHAARTVAARTITIHARGYGSLPTQGRRCGWGDANRPPRPSPGLAR
jgi:hypothetical protein